MRARRLLIVLPLLAGAMAVPSCGEPVAPLSAPHASLVTSLPHNAPRRANKTVGNMGNGLAKCDPMPNATASATIGVLGGVIQVGPHTLDIPVGALLSRVTITAIAPSDSVARIQFQPEGLVFRKPAALTMNYANCDVAASAAVQIAYTDDALVILEYVPSQDRGKTVVGQLDHFSNYAVAW
jgi:hypothetical protein